MRNKAQITDYKPGSKPDDAPDSAASLFREAFGKNTSLDEDDRSKFIWRR